MVYEIVSAIHSVKALGDMLKTAHRLANYAELVSAVSEVSTKLMSASAVALASQEKQASLRVFFPANQHPWRTPFQSVALE